MNTFKKPMHELSNMSYSSLLRTNLSVLSLVSIVCFKI